MRFAVASTLALSLGCASVPAAEPGPGGFFADAKANLNLRTFGFRNDNLDGTGAPSRTEEWAQGFVAKFQSGFTPGGIGYGLDALALAGVTLDSGRGRHVGSSMIPSDGGRAEKNWARLAPTFKARLASTELRYGALVPQLPVLMANDGRVLPQTFEGLQITSKAIDRLLLTGGRITRAVGRGSTDRTGLSVAGGIRESDAFYYGGADWAVDDALKAQYYFAKLDDYYSQHFFGAIHHLQLGENSELVTDARVFSTRSSGANSTAEGRAGGYVAGGYTEGDTGKIDNRTWSISSEYRHAGHALMIGYQAVSSGSNFVQPNQGSLEGKGAGGASTYLLTDRFIQGFNRAGERTAFAQYGFDFTAVGVVGLKASVMYLKGTDADTLAGGSAAEWERDLVVDYVIQGGPMKGIGLGWRNALSHSELSRNQDLNRLFVTYNIPLL